METFLVHLGIIVVFVVLCVAAGFFPCITIAVLSTGYIFAHGVSGYFPINDMLNVVVIAVVWFVAFLADMAIRTERKGG